jgi:DNA-directed RNA polymerase beta subunit
VRFWREFPESRKRPKLVIPPDDTGGYFVVNGSERVIVANGRLGTK